DMEFERIGQAVGTRGAGDRVIALQPGREMEADVLAGGEGEAAAIGRCDAQDAVIAVEDVYRADAKAAGVGRDLVHRSDGRRRACGRRPPATLPEIRRPSP